MKINDVCLYSLFFRNVYISGLALFLALVIRLQKKILVQDRMRGEIYGPNAMGKRTNQAMAPAGEY